MKATVTDMRNGFLVALSLAIPIVSWSPIGRDVLNSTLETSIRVQDDIFGLVLSLPVILWSS